MNAKGDNHTEKKGTDSFWPFQAFPAHQFCPDPQTGFYFIDEFYRSSRLPSLHRLSDRLPFPFRNGASANITAMGLSQAAKGIEEKCKSGDMSCIKEMFAGLKKEVESLEVFAGNGYS